MRFSSQTILSSVRLSNLGVKQSFAEDKGDTAISTVFNRCQYSILQPDWMNESEDQVSRTSGMYGSEICT